MDRALLRKFESDQDDTISKAADIDKSKDERTWPEWEVKSENYISTIPGVNGVPLSYVLRAHAAPDRTTDFQCGFTAETISRMILSSNHFQAYTRKVHQLLKNYLVD